MKNIIRTVSVATALGLAAILLLPGSPPAALAKGVKRIVDNNIPPCKGATDSTINLAVTAVMSAGSGTITVCPGVYAEEIGLANVSNVKLIGKPGAKIIPEGSSYTGAMIRVENSVNVTVQGFMLDGDGRFPDGGLTIGILYQGSSGTITRNYLSNIHGKERSSGCTGIGIEVRDAPAPVKILKNTVHDYGCNGILVTGSPRASVQKNLLWTTTAYGAQPVGVNFQASDGGSITSNLITSDWRPGMMQITCGIYLSASSNVKISGNQINHFYHGILVIAKYSHPNSDNLTISANRINDARIGLHIQVGALAAYPAPSSDNNKITGNTFYAPTYTSYAAIYLYTEDDDLTQLPAPSLTNTTISGNKQYGFPLYGGGLIVRDESGGVTHYSLSNKTIAPPTGF